MLPFVPPALPANETERQAAVDHLGIARLNPGQHAALVEEASQLFDAKIGIATILDHDRMIVAARHGTDMAEISRDISFCGHAILEPDAVMVILDAAHDGRFAGNPLVLGDPNIRFYAGAPMIAPSGHVLGALCAIDSKPRAALDPEQVARLRELADRVTAELIQAAKAAQDDA